jgi:transglutaminase/protease-like cytokinesis protein 3
MQAHGMDVGADTTARLEEIKKSQKDLGVNSFNKEQIDAAIAAEKDPEKKKALQELKMKSGEYLSVSGVQQGIAGKSSQFAESLASGKAGFGEVRAIQGAAPEQAQGMYTEAQKAEAKMDQHALTNAMSLDYAEKYAASVKTVSESTEVLAKALQLMSAAIKSGDTDRIKSAAMSSADIMAGGTGRSVKPSSPTGVRSAKDR